MSRAPYVMLVPHIIMPGNDDNVKFSGLISKGKYFAITQYRKSTFLDGGFSVWIGTARALKEVMKRHEEFTNRHGENWKIHLVTNHGTFSLGRDADSGKYKGTFRGKKIEIFQSQWW